MAFWKLQEDGGGHLVTVGMEFLIYKVSGWDKMESTPNILY